MKAIETYNGILKPGTGRDALLNNPMVRLFALLCKAGKRREACKIILDEAKKRKKPNAI